MEQAVTIIYKDLKLYISLQYASSICLFLFQYSTIDSRFT